MTSTVSRRYPILDGARAFLNYLHFDVASASLVLAFALAGGLAHNIDNFRSLESANPTLAASAGASALTRNSEHVIATLTPQMTAAMDYVVQRYHVSAEALLPVFETAQLAGLKQKIDPLLLIAVISIESRFNPFSQSAMGAQGLMQIIPRYHRDKIPQTAGDRPFLDPVVNVQIGAQILREAVQRQGGLIEGLQFYAGALADEDRTYATKVLSEKLRLEQAPRRRDGTNI